MQQALRPAERHRIVWIIPDRFDIKPDKSSWLEMGRCLRTLGWEVTILASYSGSCPQRPDDYNGLVTYVEAVDLPLIFRGSALKSMYRWIKENTAPSDVLVLNPESLFLVPLLKWNGRHRIHLDFRTLPVNVHGIKRRLDWLLFWRLTVRLWLRSVSTYSFITNRLRQEVEKQFKCIIDRYAIWQSGVNTSQFVPSLPRPSQGAFRVFYHGSLSIKRGIDNLIRAFDNISFGDDYVEVKLVLVGDGPDKEKLEVLVDKLNLGRIVTFKGFMPYEHVVREIQRADVCVCPLPDRLEWNVSSPLKIFEYMACEKPMILTPIPAHLDVLEGSPFVVWTNGFTAQCFREAIATAWREQRELRLGVAGASAAISGKFDWFAQAKKFSEFLLESYSDPISRLGPRNSSLS